MSLHNCIMDFHDKPHRRSLRFSVSSLSRLAVSRNFCNWLILVVSQPQKNFLCHLTPDLPSRGFLCLFFSPLPRRSIRNKVKFFTRGEKKINVSGIEALLMFSFSSSCSHFPFDSNSQMSNAGASAGEESEQASKGETFCGWTFFKLNSLDVEDNKSEDFITYRMVLGGIINKTPAPVMCACIGRL